MQRTRNRVSSRWTGLLMAFAICACSGPDANDQNSKTKMTHEDVTVEAAAKMIAADPEVVVLDIRTPGEYAEGHIPGAKLIDYKGAKFAEQLKELDRSKTYVMH
ncbi:MAG: rhodanese-like domain-containing protein [Planctomycetota bacterium]